MSDHTIPSTAPTVAAGSNQPQPKDELVVSGQTAESNSHPEQTGAHGGTSLLTDPHRSKGDLVLLRRAIKNRWPVLAEHQAQLVERTLELVADADPKIAVSAVRAGVAMVDANIKIDMEEDKADRLDSGLATERVDTPVRFIVGTEGKGV